MQESQLKAALLTRRAKLAEQIKSLTRQLKACDTMLAGLDADDSELPTEADVSAVLGDKPANSIEVGRLALRDDDASQHEASHPTPPPPEAPAEPPTPPPPPKIGPTPEELVQITELARSQRRGRRMALVEMAITHCGDTFSLHDVMKVLKSEFHWSGTKDMEDDIASAFWKAVRRRGYILIRPGAGRSPSIYGKTPPRVAVSS